MRILLAALLLVPACAPDKRALLEAYEAGDRRKANLAAQAIVDRQDDSAAPDLASAFRTGVSQLSKLKRERASLEKELETWKVRRDEKGKRRGDLAKWRAAKYKYDPLNGRIESTESALSHTITYLLKLESADAAKGLARVLDSSAHWVARGYAAEALGRQNTPFALNTLLPVAKKTSLPALRVALAHALRSKAEGSEDVRDLMTEWLDSPYWQVRLAAAQALAVAKDRTRTFPLINQMAVEKGRMLIELNECLMKLTGVNKNSNYQAWKAWWQQYSDDFLDGTYSPRAMERPQPEGLSAFFGIPLYSERVVFVLDSSASMKKKTKWSPDTENDPNRPKGDSTLDVAKYELRKIIDRLPNEARFNIILMRHKPETMSPRMARAGSSRTQAKKFAGDIRVDLGTNIWGALQRSLDFAGGGWLDGLRKDSIDTIYLLSDGEHTGMLVNRNQVVQRGLEALRFKKIAIHSIAVNAPSYGAKLLKDLAEGTEGTFVQR